MNISTTHLLFTLFPLRRGFFLMLVRLAACMTVSLPCAPSWIGTHEVAQGMTNESRAEFEGSDRTQVETVQLRCSRMRSVGRCELQSVMRWTKVDTSISQAAAACRDRVAAIADWSPLMRC